MVNAKKRASERPWNWWQWRLDLGIAWLNDNKHSVARKVTRACQETYGVRHVELLVKLRGAKLLQRRAH